MYSEIKKFKLKIVKNYYKQSFSFLNSIIKLIILKFLFIVGKVTIINIGQYSIKIFVPNEDIASTVDYIINNECDLIGEILSEIRPKDIIWDIGANIGVHSCFFGKKASNVIAFEPYQPNIDNLTNNKLLNNSPIQIKKLGISDKNGKEKFSVPESETQGDQWPALLPKDISKDRISKLENPSSKFIDVMKGDTLVKENIPFPNIIKIDVEGASMKVIKGLESVLENNKCRLVYIEVH